MSLWLLFWTNCSPNSRDSGGYHDDHRSVIFLKELWTFTRILVRGVGGQKKERGNGEKQRWCTCASARTHIHSYNNTCPKERNDSGAIAKELSCSVGTCLGIAMATIAKLASIANTCVYRSIYRVVNCGTCPGYISIDTGSHLQSNKHLLGLFYRQCVWDVINSLEYLLYHLCNIWACMC